MSTRITFERLSNTRDLGGMRTKDGRVVKPGCLIRSGQLYVASSKDKKKLEPMVGVIADFRTDQEVFEKPDPQFSGVRYHHIPILSSWTAGITWTEGVELSEEELFERLQKEPALARTYMCGIYRSFATNPFYLSQYRKFIELLLEGSNKAILWHCTAGKDRAGFASVLVEELLGIDTEAVKQDYLQTSVYLADEIVEITARLRLRYPEPGAVSDEAMACLFGAKREFIDALYDKIEETYGGFEPFLKDALQITWQERQQLQERYLSTEHEKG